ncbi:MAG: hypothetical protein ACM359_03915 [Bacillota bacterium]
MMAGLVSKFLAVVLAVVMTDATGVCACASTRVCGMVVEKKPAKASCQHCGKSGKDSSKSSRQQSCPSCRMTNMPDRPVVSQEQAAAMSLLVMAILPAPLPMVEMGLMERPSVGAREGIPRPPLLCDLFHSSCLLII